MASTGAPYTSATIRPDSVKAVPGFIARQDAAIVSLLAGFIARRRSFGEEEGNVIRSVFGTWPSIAGSPKLIDADCTNVVCCTIFDRILS